MSMFRNTPDNLTTHAKKGRKKLQSSIAPDQTDGSTDPETQKLIDAEAAIEQQTKGKPKSNKEKQLEAAISQKLGKPYVGNR